MLRDARTLREEELIEADVCIVGAGPAGITLAQSLEDKGVRVVLLESGGVEYDPTTLDLMRGETTGHPWYPMHEVRAAGFGGTTSLWPESGGLRSRYLDEVDFESRETNSDLGGWPFGRDELLPYYRRAEEICLLSPKSYEPADWVQPPGTSQLDLEETRFHSTMFKFTKDLGVFRNRVDEVAASESITLITHAHVARLNQSESGSLESVDVVGLWSNAFEVRSKIFVLAAGGIENARLLLLTGDGGTTSIGNQHDMVGRCFMEHLRVTSGILVPRDPHLVERLGLYQRHFVDGWKAIGVLVPDQDLIREEGILNGVVYLRPSDEIHATETYRSLAVLKDWVTRKGDVPGGPGTHIRQVLTHPGEVFGALRRKSGSAAATPLVELTLQTEQAPNLSSRVILGTEEDPLGFPRAHVDWRLTDLDVRSIRRIQELLDVNLAAAGIGRVERMYGDAQTETPIRGNWHLMGTTRMHPSPRKGVVDENSRVHGTENLYVVGSSVFPTGGFANPTLTIVALSLRLAAHLEHRLNTTPDLRVVQ